MMDDYTTIRLLGIRNDQLKTDLNASIKANKRYAKLIKDLSKENERLKKQLKNSVPIKKVG